MRNLKLSLEIIAATQKAAANFKAFVADVVSGGKTASTAGNQGEAFKSVREGAAKAREQVRKLKADVAEAQRGGLNASFTANRATNGATRVTAATQVGQPAISAQNAPSGASTNISRLIQNIDPNVARSIREIESRLKALNTTAARTGQGVSRGFSAMKQGAESVSQQLARLQQLAGSVFVARSALGTGAALAREADDYGLLESRIKLASDAGGHQLRISRQLLAVAQETRAPLAGVVDLYARTAPGLRAIGDTEGQIIATTRSVGQLLTLSGAQGGAAAGALNQFAQALGSGVLRGDEFNSINEQTPAILQAVADGLGVPRAALRKYAEEGKLTTEFVTRALASQADAIDERFAQLPETVDRSGTAVKNKFSKKLGELNQEFGVTALISRGLLSIAENIDSVFSGAYTAVLTGITLVILKSAQLAVTSQAAAAANAAERASLLLKSEALVATAVAEHAAATATLQQAEAAGAAAVANGSLAAAQTRAAATSATVTAAQSTLALASARAATGLSLGANALKLATGPAGALAITVLSTIAGYWFSVGRNAGTAADEIRRAVAEQNKGKAPQGRDEIRDTIDEGGNFTARQIREQALVVQQAKDQLAKAAAATPSADDFREGVLDTKFYSEANQKLLAAEANLAKLQDVATQEESLLEQMKARRESSLAGNASLQDEFAASAGAGGKKAQDALEKSLQTRLELRRQAAERERREAQSGLDVDFAAGKIDGSAYIEARAQLVAQSIDAQHRAVQQALAKDGIGVDLRQKLSSELAELNTQFTEQAAEVERSRIELRERGDAGIAQSTAARLRLEGEETEAAQIELQQSYREHLQQLRQAGVVNAEKMAEDWKAAQIKAIESDDIARTLDKAQAAFNQRRDTIDTQVQVGDITGTQGTARLREAQRQYLDVVRTIDARINASPDLIPAEKLEAFRAAIAQIKGELGGLDDPLREFKLTLDSAARDGLEDFFASIVNGTESAGDAFKDLGKSIIEELQSAAIKRAVNSLVDYISASFQSVSGPGGGGSVLGSLFSVGASALSGYLGGGSGVSSAGDGSFFTASSASNGAGGYRFAKGGLLSGPGTGTSDSILMRGSNGEYVLTAKTTNRIGVDNLDRLNRGGSLDSLPGYANGGLIGRAPSASGGGASRGGDTNFNLTAQVDARGATDPAAVRAAVLEGMAEMERRLRQQYTRGTGVFG